MRHRALQDARERGPADILVADGHEQPAAGDAEAFVALVVGETLAPGNRHRRLDTAAYQREDAERGVLGIERGERAALDRREGGVGEPSAESSPRAGTVVAQTRSAEELLWELEPSR